MRPARLPKVRRFPNSTLRAQAGLVATSSALRSVSRGGMDRPLRGSRRRSAMTCRSKVSINAEHWAAIARSMSS